MAALDQAEVTFKGKSLYNAYQQATASQHELEEVSCQLVKARKKLRELERKLAFMTRQGSEVVVAQELLTRRGYIEIGCAALAGSGAGYWPLPPTCR